jgi:hypothetical protein
MRPRQCPLAAELDDREEPNGRAIGAARLRERRSKFGRAAAPPQQGDTRSEQRENHAQRARDAAACATA